MALVDIQRRRNKSVSFIDDENCKKSSFNKRKSTLKKKATQLSTLCDVNVCMFYFGPDQTVETWPENRCDVLDLIGTYKGLSEKAREKGKQKYYNLTGHLRDKKRKLDEKLKKITESRKKRKIREELTNNNLGGTVPIWEERLNSLSKEGTVGLCGSLDSKLQELREVLRVLQIKKEIKLEIVNHEVEVRIDSNNLNYDLGRSNGDYFHNQQIDIANWSIVDNNDNISSNHGWIDNYDVGTLENLVFSNENHNNNHVGMVNIENNLVFNKYFSSGFASAGMGSKIGVGTGLIRESSDHGSNYFQSDDHHFMRSRTSPAYSPPQDVYQSL